jgi:hypothetical protein
MCPRQDSNLRFYLRRVALYPLSYGGLMALGRRAGTRPVTGEECYQPATAQPAAPRALLRGQP